MTVRQLASVKAEISIRNLHKPFKIVRAAGGGLDMAILHYNPKCNKWIFIFVASRQDFNYFPKSLHLNAYTYAVKCLTYSNFFYLIFKQKFQHYIQCNISFVTDTMKNKMCFNVFFSSAFIFWNLVCIMFNSLNKACNKRAPCSKTNRQNKWLKRKKSI